MFGKKDHSRGCQRLEINSQGGSSGKELRRFTLLFEREGLEEISFYILSKQATEPYPF